VHNLQAQKVQRSIACKPDAPKLGQTLGDRVHSLLCVIILPLSFEHVAAVLACILARYKNFILFMLVLDNPAHATLSSSRRTSPMA